MKVVEQLCDYLSARGLLSSDDEQRLQTRGFCLPGEYDHYDYDPWDYWNESDHYGYIDLEEEAAR